MGMRDPAIWDAVIRNAVAAGRAQHRGNPRVALLHIGMVRGFLDKAERATLGGAARSIHQGVGGAPGETGGGQ